MGPLAKSATSEVGKALQDENRYVRANALESLKHIGTEQSETIMFDFCGELDGVHRQHRKVHSKNL